MSKGWQVILKAKVEAEIFCSDACKWEKNDSTIAVCKRIVAEGVHRRCDPIDGKTKYYFGPPTPSRKMVNAI